MTTKRRFWFALATVFLATAIQTRAQETPAGHKASVTLLSSVEGVVPGRPFDVALRFELAPGWHIYWQNSGDAGLPPTIEWSLPEGFVAGDFQYPAPKREVSPGDIVTNILKGHPALLVEVTPPSAVDSPGVKLGGKVAYLICAEKCIREDAEVSVELPVQAAGTDPAPANADVFPRARRSLPKQTSKVVSVTPSVAPNPLTAGSTFELALKIDIATGHHIQSNKPTLPSLIAADVFTEKTSGIRLGKASYPPAKTRKDKYLGV